MKFDALAAYLLEQNLVDRARFDCWMDSAQLNPIWREDDEGLLIGNLQYTATYSLERIHNENSQWLMAYVLAWLQQNDDNRQQYELATPALQVDLINADLAEVEINIDFVDPIYLVLDPNGKINALGKRWGFGSNQLWVAETFRLIHGAPDA